MFRLIKKIKCDQCGVSFMPKDCNSRHFNRYKNHFCSFECSFSHMQEKSGCEKTHGMSKTSTYQVWKDMNGRCRNKNNMSYRNYGGRGIKVCDRWMKFENFYEDMGEKPDGRSLDRIDNDGNYCKENCRWATRVEQNNNQRTNTVVEIDKEKHTISEWSRILSVSYSKIMYKMYRNGGCAYDAIMFYKK